MKTMKKYLKVALCFVAFAVCSFLLAFSPTITAQAALNYTSTGYNVAINSIKMPTTKVNMEEEGAKLTIPLLQQQNLIGSEPDYIIRVIDPSGYPHEYQVKAGAENDLDYFDQSVAGEITLKVLTEGIYKIVYIVTENDVTYYSNTYEVTVENVNLQLDFSTRTGDNAGLIDLVPSKTALNTAIKLPVASVKETVSGNYIDGVVIQPKVYKNGEDAGADLVKNGDQYTLTPSTEGTYVVEYSYSTASTRLVKTYTINASSTFVAADLVLMANPTMPKVELGQKDITLPKLSFKAGAEENVQVNTLKIRIEKETDSSIFYELKNNNFKFDMTLANFENAETYDDMLGNYRVTYYVQDANGKTAEKTFKISSVSINSKPSVYMAYDYELDANGNVVGEVDTTAATELKVRYGYEEVIIPAIYATDLVSEYKDLTLVRYLVKADTKQVFYVDNVMADGTVVTAETNEFGFNYAAVNQVNKEAYDLTTEEGKTAYNQAVAEAEKKAGIKQYNKAVTFKFTDGEATKQELQELAGTYYLEYKVISNNVKTRDNYLYVSGTTEYSFVVDGNYSELPTSYHTSPKVEISNVNNQSYVNKGAKINVNVTATDEIGENEKEGIYTDSRLKTAVFYYYGSVTDTLQADIKAAIAAVKDDANFKNNTHALTSDLFLAKMPAAYTGFDAAEAGKTTNSYIVNIDSAAYPKATIVAVTVNDYNEIDIDTKTINVKVTEGDSTAPSYTVDTTNSTLTFAATEADAMVNKFAQGEEVVLPTVNFVDADGSLQLNVAYYVETPESKSAGLQYKYPSGKTFIGNSINGGKIITSQVGTYVVLYSATDAAGNTSVVYFNFEVLDSSKPVLSVEAIGDNLTQSGNTITAEKGAIISFETLLKAANGGELDTTNGSTISTTLVVKENGENLDFRPSGMGPNSYIFNTVGTYTVIANGVYDDTVLGDERVANEKVLEIIIKAPTVAWNAVDNIQSYADVDEEVFLPDLSTNYVNSVVTVSVTSSTGATITPTKDTASGQWKFKTGLIPGKYTITYSATFDDAGIALTNKVYTLKVGDLSAPTIVQDADKLSQLKQEIEYDGTNALEYSVDVDEKKQTIVITVKKNDGTTVYSLDTGIKITDDLSTSYAWDNLDIKLKSSDGTVEDGDKDNQYLIKGVGNYTLSITAKDKVGYETVNTDITFKVVNKSEVKQNNDTIVGAVLIVISLVVLGGVILFFTFTGKKGGSKKSKKANKEASKTEEVENTPVVEEAPVVEEKAEDKE